jgi:hypothetical protein
MNKVGIEYIKIKGDNKDSQFILADACEPFTEPILREMFLDAGMELLPGYKITECEIDQLIARYDLSEGIDKILIFKYKDPLTNYEGTFKGTLQQKILFSDYSTATFEKNKNSGIEGAWSYCTAQYYLVIYTKQSRQELNEAYKKNELKPIFRDAILLNLPAIHHASINHSNPNEALLLITSYNGGSTGRYNEFFMVEFDNIPPYCVLSRYKNNHCVNHEFKINPFFKIKSLHKKAI